jgi:hypothetical protein
MEEILLGRKERNLKKVEVEKKKRHLILDPTLWARLRFL